MSLLLSLPEPMWRLRLLVPNDQAGIALGALQQAGVLHPESATELEPADRAAIERERADVAGLLGELEDVLAWLPGGERIELARAGEAEIEVALVRPVGELATGVRRCCATLRAMHAEAARLEAEAGRWAELAALAGALASNAGANIRANDLCFDGVALFARLAVLPREEFELLQARLEALSHALEPVPLDDSMAVFLVGPVRHRAAVEALLQRHGRCIELPPEADALPLPELAQRAAAAQEQLERGRQSLADEIESRTRGELEDLLLLREALRAERERLTLLAMAGESRFLTLFEGWVPECAVDAAQSRLRAALDAMHLHARPATTAEHPPTRPRNPRPLRPFELVVGLFATPRYGEWDPTPVVGYFFALFFGLMLGDAVYGALLLFTALVLLPRFAADPEAEGFVAFRRLLATCAVAAMLMGVLQGAYLGDFLQHFFGLPELAISQTLHGFYLEPMVFIVASLCIGLVHVNLGHTLMLVRGLRERRPDAILGRLALFALQLAALPWILRLLGVEWLPLGEAAYTVLGWVMLGAIVAIIVASLLERGPFLGSILWVFDISGILGDVMSYARLAGVGLATYFLAYSFNMLATLVAGMLPGGAAGLVLTGVVVTFILVLGHLLNLVLSAITCFVHALRLCFVEFLFKFYEGGGRPYAPFRLRRRRVLPVKAGGAGA